MMQYSRLGLYVDREKKSKKSSSKKGKSMDFVNIFLFVLLFVVVVLFVVT